MTRPSLKCSSRRRSESTDVARIRSQIDVTQPLFARLPGISEKTLQNWEQGRRTPTGPAKVLLKVAARHPKLLLETVK